MNPTPSEIDPLAKEIARVLLAKFGVGTFKGWFQEWRAVEPAHLEKIIDRVVKNHERVHASIPRDG